VCKVSSGASECAELYAVKSLKPFLAEAIARGWVVVSTKIEKENDVQMRLNINQKENKEEINEEKDENTAPSTVTESTNVSLLELNNLNNTSNIILVLGSEANGITSNLTNVTNYNVYIPPLLNKDLTNKKPFDIIDSLNVGVSAGIIINHLKSKLITSGETASKI